MEQTKKFDVDLYKKNDLLAKHKARQLFNLILKDSNIYENPNQYSIDLIIDRNNERFGYIEAEIKQIWISEQFPFDTIQIPKRKLKFTEEELNVYFCVFSKDLSYVAVITKEILLKSPLVEVSNKYIANGEYFFQVDVNNVCFYNCEF